MCSELSTTGKWMPICARQKMKGRKESSKLHSQAGHLRSCRRSTLGFRSAWTTWRRPKRRVPVHCHWLQCLSVPCKHGETGGFVSAGAWGFSGQAYSGHASGEGYAAMFALPVSDSGFPNPTSALWEEGMPMLDAHAGCPCWFLVSMAKKEYWPR